MIDRHTFRDHRMDAAQATGDRYAPERGYCFVPAEPKAPASVRIVTAAILMIGVLSFFGFAIARAVL